MTQKEKDTIFSELENAIINVRILGSTVESQFRELPNECGHSELDNAICAMEVLHEVSDDYLLAKVENILDRMVILSEG